MALPPIPPINLNEQINQDTAPFLIALSVLQVYIDDWALLDAGLKTAVKDRFDDEVDAQITYLNDVKAYVAGL